MQRTMFMKKAIKYLKDPEELVIALSSHGLLPFISDELYLKLLYKKRMGQPLNLLRPSRYTEKLQWMKLYYHKPLYTLLVDKYEVKNVIGNLIGSEHIVKNVGGPWNSFDEIDFSALPNSFVLKCTHDSGGIVICRDKKTLDIEKARNKIEKCLKRDFYNFGKEWPYKNVKPRIIAEELLEDPIGADLKDYKLFCFNGKVKLLFVASDRQNVEEETKFDFYDADFNKLDIKNGHPNSENSLPAPKNFNKMIELAEIISKDEPHMRVDFYDINGQIYFGEITFFHHSGLVRFEPDEWDYILGDWLDLPIKKIL